MEACAVALDLPLATPDPPRLVSLAKQSRRWHRIGALITFVPVAIIFASGVILQLKKDWDWVQPPTRRGSSQELVLGWEEVLAAAREIPEAEVETWDDIDRLDVRPARGMLKVRCANGWEVQLDAKTGDVLSSTERRSDWIESIHDGSWFHDQVKLWVFLPTALILCGLWITGVHLWLLPHLVRRRRSGPA